MTGRTLARRWKVCEGLTPVCQESVAVPSCHWRTLPSQGDDYRPVGSSTTLLARRPGSVGSYRAGRRGVFWDASAGLRAACAAATAGCRRTGRPSVFAGSGTSDRRGGCAGAASPVVVALGHPPDAASVHRHCCHHHWVYTAVSADCQPKTVAVSHCRLLLLLQMASCQERESDCRPCETEN